MTVNPEDFGYHGLRELHRKEMCCIIYKLRDHKLFSQVRDIIPESWDEEWIDYIHSYVYPDIDTKILEIYTEYAEKIKDCLPGFLPGYRE